MSSTHRRTVTFAAGAKVAVKKKKKERDVNLSTRGRLVKNTGSGRDVSASASGGGGGGRGGGQEHALESVAQNFNQPGTPDGTFPTSCGFVSPVQLVKSPHKEFLGTGRQDLEGDWVRLTNQICY